MQSTVKLVAKNLRVRIVRQGSLVHRPIMNWHGLERSGERGKARLLSAGDLQVLRYGNMAAYLGK